MAKDIRLSEKHGVNPTLGRCFWCGGDSGEIGLLGRLPGDAEAPRHLVLSYDPCDVCAPQWAQGVVFIEANAEPAYEGQPPLRTSAEAYPTGRHVVLTRVACERIFEGTVLEGMLRHGKALVEPEAFERLVPAELR